MKRVFILFFLTIISFAGLCQQSALNQIDSLISAANFERARAVIDQTGKRFPDLKTKSLLQNKSCVILMTEGKTAEAESLLAAINPGSDRFIEAITETNYGFLNLSKARNDLALEHLQKAQVLFQSSGTAGTKEAANCLADMSLVYFSTGKMNQAESSGIIALQIRQRLYDEGSDAVAASYNDLGLVYSQTDPDKALEYYEKALAVYEKLNGPEHPKIAQAKSNIGFLYRKLELYGDAINNFETAAVILKKNYPQGHPSEAFAEVNLGLTYLQMKDTKVALAYLEKALKMYQAFYGPRHSDIAFVYNQIGLIKLKDNQYLSAIGDFQSALHANVPGFENVDFTVTPSVKRYYNGKIMLYSIRLKAQALEALYFGKTLKRDHLLLALHSLHACDSLIDDIRHHSTDENDKIELGESANETYEDGVRIAVALSEISLDARHFREEAFYFAEKSKSAVLQESIAEAEAKSFAGIPSELLEQEKALKSSMSLVDQQLAQKPGENEEKLLRQKQFDLSRDYNLFTKNLELSYPAYFNLKFNSASPSVAQVQKILDNNTGVVSYFLAEKGKKLYQFLITKKNFKIRTSTTPDNFDKVLRGFSNSILHSIAASYKTTGETLSKILAPRFPAAINDVVIIPSGKLGTLPFEAVPSRNFRGANFNAVPYLLNKYAIRYEFSAGLMVQRNRKQPPGQPTIFLCAPVLFDSKTQLADLPGTEQEVQQISKIFGDGASFIAKREGATEAMAKSGKLADYNYLHFATHGIVDEENPELSRIFLQEGAAEDGNLYTGEIYNLNLKSDLTVLSACQTGLGKFSAGEGVIGLTRALKYAGSKNIIVSFWSVADESTSLLMTDFYSILLKARKTSFSETLRESKLKMIQDGKYSEPFYWAPFVLIGF